MKIGFYSSSTAITQLSPKRFRRAESFLKSKGAELVPGNLTGKNDFYRSASIQQRAEEINSLIHNESLDIIMSTIGGTNTNSVLPYIDYDYLAEHPKTFVGYSDASALLLAVKTLVPNCRVLYGPALVASFGEWPPYSEQTWQYFKKIVDTPRKTSVSLKAPEFWTDEKANWEVFEHEKKNYKNTWKYINSPVLSGRLIGGNLNTIYGILASRYFPKIFDNDILFIEDGEKDASTVEKNFAMIKNAGIFDKVKGIILGKHSLFDDNGSNRLPAEILKEVLNDSNLPIIYDYDSCHTIPMITTPIASQVKIDAKNMTISFSNF